MFTHGIKKAVAAEVISYYVDHFVTGRISKFTYGTPCDIPYQPFDPEHVRCEYKSHFGPLEEKWVPNIFATLLLQVCHPPASTSSFYRKVLGFRKTTKFDKTSVISLGAPHSDTLSN